MYSRVKITFLKFCLFYCVIGCYNNKLYGSLSCSNTDIQILQWYWTPLFVAFECEFCILECASSCGLTGRATDGRLILFCSIGSQKT